MTIAPITLVSAIIAARVRGAGTSAIRALVVELIAARRQAS
jgi:hypothetical protein